MLSREPDFYVDKTFLEGTFDGGGTERFQRCREENVHCGFLRWERPAPEAVANPLQAKHSVSLTLVSSS